MIRILVIDDHAVVRAGIKQFLDDIEDIEVAGEAASAIDAAREIRRTDYDVVLLDISLPDKSGIEALKQIKRDRPTLPVLVLSMHPEQRYAVQALRSGACGYLQKETMPTELVRAIRAAYQGRRYVSAALAELLVAELDRDDERPLHESLSARERDVFMLLAQGHTVGSIADALSLNARTISTYRARIFEKMNASSNADLTYYAIKNGLID